MMSNPSSNPPKILSIHAGGIGDLFLALPAMRLFRQAFPHSSFHLMGYRERLAVVAYDLKAEALHSVDQAGMAYFYEEDSSLPTGLINLFSSFGFVLHFGRRTGETLSKNLRRAGVGRVLTLSSFPPEGLKVHVSDYLLTSLKEKGIEGEAPDQPLQLSEEAMQFSSDYWARSGVKENERILAIHPGSGSPIKNWPPCRFARVADWASERARVLLISGPAQDGVKEVIESLKKATPLVAKNLSLLQLASVLRRCTTYLGNDSGITHLASFLGLRTVALFGPTDPEVWGPRGSSVRIMAGVRSVPSFSSEAQGHGDVPRPVSLEPDEVIEVLTPLLG